MSETTRCAPGIGGVRDAIAPAVLGVGALLAAAGFVLAFTSAPLVNGAGVNEPAVINGVVVTNKLLLSQKIFYWHVPVAVASALMLVFMAYCSVRVLMTHARAFDARAKVAMEVGLVFVVCTMVSGIFWTRFEWGVWWTWEPRLTTYFILMMLIFAYFILRNAVEDPERRARYAAVFGLLAFADVPVSFAITRLVPSSLHPVVFRTDSGLSPEMLLPFLLSVFGMAMVAYGLFRFRLRVQVMEDSIEEINERLED